MSYDIKDVQAAVLCMLVAMELHKSHLKIQTHLPLLIKKAKSSNAITSYRSQYKLGYCQCLYV